MNKWLNSAVKAYTDKYGIVKAPLVYEVGSRDARDGVELAQRISNNQISWENIVAFECNPPSIEVIKQNYPNVTLITDAISDVSGKTVEFLQIHGDRNVVGSSSMNLDRAKESWAKDHEIIKVKTRRLDEVIKSLNHEDTEIDIMKIDVEHYSWEALQSLGKYLRNIKVYHIECELEYAARDKNNLDIVLFMEANGYKLVGVESEWGDPIQDHIYRRVDV